MECLSPNSQRSARCHLSEMDLTRQRLVTFPSRGNVRHWEAARRPNQVHVDVRHFRHDLVCAN